MIGAEGVQRGSIRIGERSGGEGGRRRGEVHGINWRSILDQLEIEFEARLSA